MNIEIEREIEITRNLINNAIMKYLPLNSKTLPYPFIKHIIKAPGKRIRASVLIWSCESVGGQPTQALPIAVAYEFGHTASLIQDDLMDRSLLRRSVVPVHIKWGQDAAILSSDVLVFHIFNILSEMAMKDFPKEVLSRIIRITGETGINMCKGQSLDVASGGRVSIPKYFDIISNKTASILKASAEIGAMVGSGDEREIKMLKDYGKNLGMAIQITDDILNVYGESIIMGKPVGTDILSKPNILVSYFNEKNPKRSLKTENIKAELTEAREYAEKKAKEYIYQAKDSIKKLKESSAKEKFLALADFVLNRKY